MGSQPLAAKVGFILELDKLKGVIRQTFLLNKSRQENTAEHSWQLAMAVIVFSEYAHTKNLDLLKAIKMALIHDIVEIDAGDTFVYDQQASDTKAQRERAAADRIFHLLPKHLGEELHALWLEFDALASAEAKFVNALDRLLPLIQNRYSGAHSWRKHQIKYNQVLSRNRGIEAGAPELWDFALNLLDEALREGLLNK